MAGSSGVSATSRTSARAAGEIKEASDIKAEDAQIITEPLPELPLRKAPEKSNPDQIVLSPDPSGPNLSDLGIKRVQINSTSSKSARVVDLLNYYDTTGIPTEKLTAYMVFHPEDYYMFVNRINPRSPIYCFAKQKNFRNSQFTDEALYNNTLFGKPDGQYVALDLDFTSSGPRRRFASGGFMDGLKECLDNKKCVEMIGAAGGILLAAKKGGEDEKILRYFVLDLADPLRTKVSIPAVVKKLEDGTTAIVDPYEGKSYEDNLFNNPGQRYLAIDTKFETYPRFLNSECIENPGGCSKRSKRSTRAVALRGKA